MSYSSDLRKRVLDFLNTGGSKAEASRTYSVSRTCIYNWLDAEDPLRCQKPGPRGPHRLDYNALKQHVADFPDQTQIERTLRGFKELYLVCAEKTQHHAKKKR